MIKAIFMDFDGTVSDARGIAEESLIRTLDDFNFKYNRKRALSLLGNKMHIILERLGVSVDDLQRVRRRFYKHFIAAAKRGDISPCCDLKPLWEIGKDIPLFVVSNSETAFLRASIKTLNIRGMFKGVYGAEKFSSKDEFLSKRFKRMGLSHDEVMYIGDRFSDVDFARDAGCIAVAIHNKCSWSSLARVKRERPDYIVKDFKELQRLVGKLNK